MFKLVKVVGTVQEYRCKDIRPIPRNDLAVISSSTVIHRAQNITHVFHERFMPVPRVISIRGAEFLKYCLISRVWELVPQSHQD